MFKRLALAVCLPFLVAPAAEAANHGFYWGIEAGVDLPRTFLYETGPWMRTFDEPMNTGATVLATLGAYVGPQLRLEAEAGYILDDLRYAGVWSEFSLIGNVLYDIPLGSDLAASIGGGIGADLVQTYSKSDVGFAFQILAGLAWSISDQTAVTLQYRYRSASGPTFDSGAGPMEYHNLTHQSLSLGLRFAM